MVRWRYTGGPLVVHWWSTGTTGGPLGEGCGKVQLKLFRQGDYNLMLTLFAYLMQ